MKVEISSVKAHVAVHFGLDGLVLADIIQASAPKVKTSYEIKSSDDPERVAAVLRNARNGAGCGRGCQSHPLRGQADAERKAHLLRLTTGCPVAMGKCRGARRCAPTFPGGISLGPFTSPGSPE